MWKARATGYPEDPPAPVTPGPGRSPPIHPMESLGRLGTLEVRLTVDRREMRKAQRLRSKVFFEEGGAIPDARTAFTRRDADRFDKYCDHLIVIDHGAMTKKGKSRPKIVGTYRLLRDEMAERAGGYYAAGEYDIAPLLDRHRNQRILELGRSCVLASHRGQRTLELLWRGLLAYIRAHRIDMMFGCASFPGVRPADHAEALSYLAHFASAGDMWSVRARRELYVPMAMLPRESMDEKKSRAALAPLVKGYLRLGARFGDGAVVDDKFNTTDVFVVMPVARIETRYLEFLGRETRRAA